MTYEGYPGGPGCMGALEAVRECLPVGPKVRANPKDLKEALLSAAETVREALSKPLRHWRI
eukprot:1183686-Prorocentrum_minimum.AAC.1